MSLVTTILLFSTAVLFSFVYGDESCPALYKRYSNIHTFCQPPSKTCKKIEVQPVSEQDIKTILEAHNLYRSKLAMGLENGSAHGSLPKASNILEIVWDKELAEIAQKHADQCVFQHDCNDCRRSTQFSVGQNLYIRSTTGTVTKSIWKRAIDSWYNEVQYFDVKSITPFTTESKLGVVGHYTQLSWAESWRIGCGRTVFKSEKYSKELYTCNYGPAGNMLGDAMYKAGEPCSDCPVNSCCGETCNQSTKPTVYPGLCKITDNKAPKYKSEENLIYSCDFEDESKCNFDMSALQNGWKVSHTLSGSYIGIILKGGEERLLNFTTLFKHPNGIDVSLYYRKGANVAGEEANSVATEYFYAPDIGSEFTTTLTSYDSSFSQFDMNLNFQDVGIKFAIGFSVPSGAPDQYLEIKDITVKELKE